MISSNNENIVLYGGQGDIFASLNLSAGDMPYLMLETAEYGIAFGSTAEYAFTPEWTVLRFHAFGNGGDLLIRRDEDRIFWRFVGYNKVFNQLGLTSETPYPEILEIKDEDVRSLLWGAYWGQDDSGQHHWQENRVGKAQLTYPFPEPAERVEIRACRVLDTNTRETVAYWTYDLAEHQPQKSQ
jgi:hypothetical protein